MVCYIKDMRNPKRPKDTNQLAKLIVDIATDQVEDIIPPTKLTGV